MLTNAEKLVLAIGIVAILSLAYIIHNFKDKIDCLEVIATDICEGKEKRFSKFGNPTLTSFTSFYCIDEGNHIEYNFTKEDELSC